MKVRQLIGLMCSIALVFPLLANAQIYKWKDKDGSIRYSDTPPPSNIKPQSIGGKKVADPTGKQPLSPVTDSAKAPASAKEAKDSKEAVGKESKEDEAAKLRQKNAEIEKKNKVEKESQAKLKAENCKAAKANHESFAQGGRVYKTNEKGEREYMSDKDLKEGAEKTQAEINEYCN